MTQFKKRGFAVRQVASGQRDHTGAALLLVDDGEHDPLGVPGARCLRRQGEVLAAESLHGCALLLDDQHSARLVAHDWKRMRTRDSGL